MCLIVLEMCLNVVKTSGLIKAKSCFSGGLVQSFDLGFPRDHSRPSEGEEKKERSRPRRKENKEKTRKKGPRFSNKVEFCLTLEDYQARRLDSCFSKLILILPSFIYDC